MYNHVSRINGAFANGSLRDSIMGNITHAIKQKFVEQGGMFSLVHLQLRQIDLPGEFESAILQKILYLQEQKAAKNTQQVEIQKANIKKEGVTWRSIDVFRPRRAVLFYLSAGTRRETCDRDSHT